MVDAALSRAGATMLPYARPYCRAKSFSACSSCHRRPYSCWSFSPIRSGGVWLGFTDTRIGRSGVFIGLENYQLLWDDSLFWLSVFNTILYTVVASILKFMLGLWLALLLNEHIPFKAFIRAIVLLPWVVPTVLSAIAFWWIYDTQFSIISWALMKIGWISPINFLGDPNNARATVILTNVGAAFPSWRSRCWPAFRRFRPRSMKRRPSTARPPGRGSATSRYPCSRP